jgi:hypothetical protein
MVHCLRDVGDLDQALLSQVGFPFHHPHNNRKLLELFGFCRSQWVLFEERDNAANQVFESIHIIPVQVLSMVVASSVDEDSAAFEELSQLVQDMHASRPLNHSEYRLDLPAQSHGGASEDRNAEAPFSVNESDDPLLES